MQADIDASFAAFVSARSGRLIAQATMLCGDRQHAQDIVQTALVRAYPRWRHIERDDPYAYMVRAVTNVTTDWWRRSHRRHEQLDPAPAGGRSAELGSRLEDSELLAAAMSRLTTRERATVVLRYMEDLSERTVAETLGVTAGTVKTTAHRALGKLRAALAEPGLTASGDADRALPALRSGEQ